MTNFELLRVVDAGNYYDVVGVVNTDDRVIDLTDSTARASAVAVNIVKDALEQKKIVKIPKIVKYSEVVPGDLIISDVSTLDDSKALILMELSNKMNMAMVSLTIVDMFEFLESYMAMLNAGIFITEDNRQSVYLDIIEKSQIEKPVLVENATQEQEAEYMEELDKYDKAQHTLKLLETYLNGHDRLANVSNLAHYIRNVRDRLQAATTEEEVTAVKQETVDRLYAV